MLVISMTMIRGNNSARTAQQGRLRRRLNNEGLQMEKNLDIFLLNT